MNRKIRGAKEFKDVVQVKEDAKTWRKDLEKMNEGIFLFDQSVCTQAGNFNKQRGSMELTASRSLMAIEKRHAIHDTASQVFAGTPKDAEMRGIMAWWLKAAEHLREIGLLMKSQELMTPDRLRSLKKNLVLCVLKHRERVTTKNSIFWKVRASLRCFVNFCKKTGMGGSNSPRKTWRTIIMWWVSSKLQCSPLQTQTQRQQMFLLPNVAKKLNTVEGKAVRTGKRGPCKNRGNAAKAKEVIELLEEEEEDRSEIPDGFLFSPKVELFQSRWKRSAICSNGLQLQKHSVNVLRTTMKWETQPSCALITCGQAASMRWQVQSNDSEEGQLLKLAGCSKATKRADSKLDNT